MEYFLMLIIIVLIILLVSRNSSKQGKLTQFYTFESKLDKIISEMKILHQKIEQLNERGIQREIHEIKEIPLKEELKIDEKIEQIQTPIIPLIQEEKKNLEPIVEKLTEIKETVVDISQPSIKSHREHYYESNKAINAINEKGFWDKFKEKNPDLEKFIGENLISKIGIVILVLGISSFVKFAIDKEWINESGRVGIGILCGIILLGFSHYLHKQYKAFSSILVSGAITVFYFTIAYGFHRYHLYSQSIAFGIMIFITLFSTLVSVYYSRQELAILSIIGGFAVPFMVSNGEGNYIALFTYILILNVGMLILSYFKSWDIVKIVSFAFTYLIFVVWYNSQYNAISLIAHNKAFLFLNIFYLLFLTMNLVDIIKNRPIHFGFKVGFLLVSTALTYFISMDILNEYHLNFKGLYTLSFSIINLVVTYIVYKRNQNQRNIIYLLLGLTLTFATIAIPVQFDGYYVSIFWAAEALLLLGLSYKSKINSFFTASIIVYLLMLISLAMDWGHYNSDYLYPVIFNSIFLTGIVCNLSIYIAAWVIRRYEMKLSIFNQDKFDAYIFLVAGVVLSYLIGFFEVQYQGNQFYGNMIADQSVLMSYHYIFTTLGIVLFSRYHDNRFLFTVFFGVINILLFVMFNAYQPFYEMVAGIDQSMNQSLAFTCNFIYLVCIVISLIVLVYRYNSFPQLYLLEKKYLISLLLIFIVFLFSNQLLMYILRSKIQFNPTYLETYIGLKYQLYKVLYPIVWGSLSLIYLAYGIRNKNRPVRIISLSLLLITVIKLFAYDIRNVSEGGKILAFILLGILILIMSFMYQKIKFLILDESKSESN